MAKRSYSQALFYDELSLRMPDIRKASCVSMMLSNQIALFLSGYMENVEIVTSVSIRGVVTVSGIILDYMY